MPVEPANNAKVPATLADRLEWLRHEWGLSHSAMDQRVQVATGSFLRYINHGREPKAETLRKLCELGVDPRWLLTGEGKPFIVPDPSRDVQRVEFATDRLVQMIEALQQAVSALAPLLSPPERSRVVTALADVLGNLDRDPLA